MLFSRSKVSALLWGALFACKLTAQQRQITFAHDIAPIIHKSCVPCHYAGGPGPFPLSSFSDVRSHGRQIAAVTRSRYMPPWLPEHEYGEFADELRLTDQEIQNIVLWVQEGTPEGPASEEPAAPVILDGWPLGQPNLIVKATKPVRIPADGTDVFWNFVLAPQIDTTQFVRAVDIRLSNPQIVHHANIVIDRLGSTRSRERFPGSGFPGMDISVLSSPLDLDGHPLFWKPGSIPYSEPSGLAWRLDPGNDLILNVRLQPSGKTEWEQPMIGLYFTDQRPRRFPYLLQLERDGAIDIPPGDHDFVIRDRFRLPIDTEVLAVYPHAHYLGTLLEAWARLPDGTRQWLIRIPHWDQNWQAVYRYKAPLQLPAGTTIEMEYHYDNSADNPRNPNQPPKGVSSGNLATDEMGHLWLEVLPKHLPDGRRLYAEAWAQHQLEKYPADYDADVTLGALALSRLHSQAAVTPLHDAVHLRPGDAIAHNLYGAALEAMGRNLEAVEQFRLAVWYRPDFANARFNLARSLARTGDHAGAIEQLQSILKANPADTLAAEYLVQLQKTVPE